ncbi:unnamed protein product [Linum trigynum]|uniref:Uncharacterized protein n=1 Tax=Linum trigynum TaxID=586398 RepID=A0AAV2CW62_9ROSI
MAAAFRLRAAFIQRVATSEVLGLALEKRRHRFFVFIVLFSVALPEIGGSALVHRRGVDVIGLWSARGFGSGSGSRLRLGF